MAEAVAPSPREHGWWKLLVALAAFLLLPLVPLVRAAVPVGEPMLLLAPALAVCALLGWRGGGRVAWTLFFIALAALATVRPPETESAGYADLARGWSLLVAGSFGLVSLFGRSRSFLPRALSALGIAGAVVLLLIAVGVLAPDAAANTIHAQLGARNAEALAAMRDWAVRHGADWNALSERLPSAQELVQRNQAQLPRLSDAALVVFPALLALETLVALALAWALYHRLSRSRIGAPLAPLRDFRFNDQLVWGLVTGVAIVVLPTLAAMRGVGVNMLVFFGALYALRGIAVLVWILSPSTAALVAAVIAGVLLLPLFTAVTVGLGLGDTWLNWRRRSRPTP